MRTLTERKLLLYIPSPRDTKQFYEAIKKIPYDKIWMKYMPYKLDPYGQAKKFFLKNKQYTHFAICPDDLEVTPEGVERLWEDSNKYQIISGLCNVNMVDMDDENGFVAITKNLPSGSLTVASYDMYRKKEVPKDTFLKVQWAGTAFMIIPREILKQLSFKPYTYEKNKLYGSYDVQIAHDLIKLGIDQYVDTNVYFRHFRLSLAKYLNQHQPAIWYDVVGKKRQYLKGKPSKPHLLDMMELMKVGIVEKPKKKEIPRIVLGWWIVQGDKEIHFFKSGNSLCGRYDTVSSVVEPRKIDREKNDHCAACESVLIAPQH